MSNHKCTAAAPMGHPRNPLSFYFVAGGLGDVCAALVSHPMDVVKVRQQLQGELGASKDGGLGIRNFARTVTTIVRGEGALIGLYRGMSASVARQSSFSTMRHGGYASACTLAVHGSFSAPNWSPNAASRSVPHPASEASVMQRLAAGCACGSVAAFIANPTDVVLVRMQADGHWPLARRRGYYNIFDGARRIVFEEGPRRLWRGSGPTVFRAMLVTATQIPAYFWAKEWLVERVKFGKGKSPRVVAGALGVIFAPTLTAHHPPEQQDPTIHLFTSCQVFFRQALHRLPLRPSMLSRRE